MKTNLLPQGQVDLLSGRKSWEQISKQVTQARHISTAEMDLKDLYMGSASFPDGPHPPPRDGLQGPYMVNASFPAGPSPPPRAAWLWEAAERTPGTVEQCDD